MDWDVDTLLKGFEILSRGTSATDNALALVEKIRNRLKKTENQKTDGERSVEDEELANLILELKSEITDTKLANINLKEQVVALRSKLLDLAQKEIDFDRYELFETSQHHFVYRLKEGAADGEKTHFICPKCKESGVKSILQGDRYFRRCPSCDFYYDFEASPSYSPEGGGFY